MFTPATDIGQSVLLAVREEASKTRALNRKLVRHLGKAIREDGRQTRAAIKEDGRQTRAVIRDAGKQIEATSREIRATSRDNREFFRQMLETQNRILGKAP